MTLRKWFMTVESKLETTIVIRYIQFIGPRRGRLSKGVYIDRWCVTNVCLEHSQLQSTANTNRERDVYGTMVFGLPTHGITYLSL